MAVATYLRPDIVMIERRLRGAVGPTGEAPLAPSTIATGIPALLTPVAVTGTAGGAFAATIEGQTFLQTHVLLIDALPPQRYRPLGPGAPITLDGVPYTVAQNDLGAYVDLLPGDRMTDQDGRTFLVLGVDRYYLLIPSTQARVVFGEAW